MDLSPVLARLVGEVTLCRSIGGAADLAAIDDGLVVTPALFLLAAKEAASDVGFAGATVQRVQASFFVALAVSNEGSAQGEGALGELEPFRDQVKAALLGWVPADSHDPVAYVGGALVSFNDATLLWMDEFKTTYYIRSPL